MAATLSRVYGLVPLGQPLILSFFHMKQCYFLSFCKTSNKVHLLIEFGLYIMLEYLVVDNNFVYQHTLWIPNYILLLIPGFIVGLSFFSSFKKVLFFSIFCYPIFRIFFFVLYWEFGALPLYMEAIIYLTMTGYAFGGSILGYLLRNIVITPPPKAVA
jgi:hypothetical protein